MTDPSTERNALLSVRSRLAQRRICLGCEETFTLGEMYPGKRYIDPPECPYCRSPRSAVLQQTNGSEK